MKWLFVPAEEALLPKEFFLLHGKYLFHGLNTHAHLLCIFLFIWLIMQMMKKKIYVPTPR